MAPSRSSAPLSGVSALAERPPFVTSLTTRSWQISDHLRLHKTGDPYAMCYPLRLLLVINYGIEISIVVKHGPFWFSTVLVNNIGSATHNRQEKP